MPLIRYLAYVIRQLLGFTLGTRRPGVLILLIVGGLVVLVGAALQLAAPLAIYPFL